VSAVTNLIKDIVIMLKPIMPKTALKFEEQLNIKNTTFEDIGKPLGKHRINKAEIILQKIEKPKIGVSPFANLNLKVAKILSAENHPDADRLFVLKITLGNEERQLVAGIRGHYAKEELAGKKIVIVSNLQHAKLKGILSQGMLLAATSGDKVVLISPGDANPGDQVFIEGIEPSIKEITIKEFIEAPLKVKNKKVVFNEDILKTAKGELSVDAQDGSTVK
jgi:methionyl-tRNA synthetase